MLARMALLALLALAVALLWGCLRIWRTARLTRLRDVRPLAGLIPTGQPAVVAFTSPACAECRTRQAPALEHLRGALGARITVAALSAPDHLALVEQLGILTVPATVVLDAAGVVRFVNLGFTDAEHLAGQVRGVDTSAALCAGRPPARRRTM